MSFLLRKKTHMVLNENRIIVTIVNIKQKQNVQSIVDTLLGRISMSPCEVQLKNPKLSAV